MDPTLVVIAAISSIAAVVSGYFAYRGSTRAAALNASASERVADRANELQWVKEVREDAAAARRDLAAARSEAEQCRSELRMVKREATALADELHRIVRAIHDPLMSIDRLRVMVPPPPRNGSTPT